jgi:hypothetical protein
MPVIPTFWETEAGRSQSEAGMGRNVKPYLKNKLKQKNWGCGSSDQALAE